MKARRHRWLPVVAGSMLVSGSLTMVPRAQQDQPVYPAYDGYVKNGDGSYTLSFAYFSHNGATVTIPPGAGNAFAPTPGDRQQPTAFKPGHWRFQCVMVVGPEFDGKLTWTITYAGATTGTSQRMLQSNWSLVEGAEDLSKIDYAHAPRGVCLNRPPNVRVLGASRDGRAAITATVGAVYSLFGSVADEGLPRGSSVLATWTLVAGPGQVKFENPNSARTHATFSAAGDYELQLSATDSELSSSTRLKIKVDGRGR